jgi:hypothetical protein
MKSAPPISGTYSAKATFCKALLNYCRHDGFLRHSNTMHDIQDVQFLCLLQVYTCFLQHKMYYTPSTLSYHTVYDALIQWFQAISSVQQMVQQAHVIMGSTLIHQQKHICDPANNATQAFLENL